MTEYVETIDNISHENVKSCIYKKRHRTYVLKDN